MKYSLTRRNQRQVEKIFSDKGLKTKRKQKLGKDKINAYNGKNL